jgi:hypothetical protein
MGGSVAHEAGAAGGHISIAEQSSMALGKSAMPMNVTGLCLRICEATV